jgi:hypothetical protein
LRTSQDNGGASTSTNNASFQLSQITTLSRPTMVNVSRISEVIDLVTASATCSTLNVSRDSRWPVPSRS